MKHPQLYSDNGRPKESIVSSSYFVSDRPTHDFGHVENIALNS